MTEKYSDEFLHQLLKNHFGYDTFRPPQLDIIHSIVSGQDTFVLLPTGAGKSLCYQLPALALSGITIVISPLIALMKDQVDHLTSQGISAACVNSTMPIPQLQQVARDVNNGKIKILFVSPERLAVPTFQEWLMRRNVSLIAIDEAHCISEWGHDFRPNYRQLSILKTIFPHVPLIALTATAVLQARKDIQTVLQLKNSKTFQTSFNRPNLHYIIRHTQNISEEAVAWIQKYQDESIVIYCLSRKKTEQVAEEIIEAGFKAAAYHAGLIKEKRQSVQDDFLHDRVKIVVATIAFGMGIDKPNIRLVIHYELPKSLEGYYQETGRAGRDGLQSHCVLFYSPSSEKIHQRFIEKIESQKTKKMALQKLNAMVKYCQKNQCRRKMILQYFDEKFSQGNCQSCDQCVPQYQQAVLIPNEADAPEVNTHVFRELKKLRLEIAHNEQVPAFVIFGDQSVVEMATYLPQSLQEFSAINGVGAYKLNKYGEIFTQKIRSLCKELNLQSVKKRHRGRSIKIPKK